MASRRGVVTTLKLIVVVGCASDVVAACRRVAPSRTVVREMELKDAAARVPRWRPLVVVVPHAVYMAHERWLISLAEGVGAVLVPIPHDNLRAVALRAVLLNALETAEAGGT